jgi:predicted PolB exonuclease-like 3'-5' exonuclease
MVLIDCENVIRWALLSTQELSGEDFMPLYLAAMDGRSCDFIKK